MEILQLLSFFDDKDNAMQVKFDKFEGQKEPDPGVRTLRYVFFVLEVFFGHLKKA